LDNLEKYMFHGLFIYSGKTFLCLGHLAPASEVTGSRTYLTILESADNVLFKMVRYIFLRLLRPELDGQDVEASFREDTSSSSRWTGHHRVGRIRFDAPVHNAFGRRRVFTLQMNNALVLSVRSALVSSIKLYLSCQEIELYYESHQYRNKSKSQLTSPTPAQLPVVAVSTGHIVYDEPKRPSM
jgi:hypothetical protein